MIKIVKFGSGNIDYVYSLDHIVVLQNEINHIDYIIEQAYKKGITIPNLI